jgi:hypothetical protein
MRGFTPTGVEAAARVPDRDGPGIRHLHDGATPFVTQSAYGPNASATGNE